MKLPFFVRLIGLLLFVGSLSPLAAQNNSSSVNIDTSSVVLNDDSTIAATSLQLNNKSNLIDENDLKSSGNLAASIPRGILGMAVLIFIAYLFSSNRKAISWRVVGIGLGIQLFLAFGILKIAFVRTLFEFVGKIFVVILDFTRIGSEFLFRDLMDVSTFGFILSLQI